MYESYVTVVAAAGGPPLNMSQMLRTKSITYSTIEPYIDEPS